MSENKPVDRIKKINIPILLGHGKKDNLIPFWNSEKLFKANKNILFMKLSGGHSLYWQNKAERNKYLKRLSQLMDKNLW